MGGMEEEVPKISRFADVHRSVDHGRNHRTQTTSVHNRYNYMRQAKNIDMYAN